MLNKLKPRSEFSRNVLTLMTGTTIAQAIPIAISPILTRIYTPEDFGVLALFVAITSIFGSIANGRYELAIMLPRKDEDAINILALGFIINVIISSVLLCIIFIFHTEIIDILGNKEISYWLYLMPVSVFLIGCFNLLNYFNNRKKQYKDLAKANVYKSIASAIVQLGLGFTKAGVLGLISGQFISQLVSNITLLSNIKRLNLFRYIKKNRMVYLTKRYKNHPVYLLPTTLFDTFSLKVPVFGINYFLSIGTLGQYALMERILAIPSGLIGGSIGQVFYREFNMFILDNKYHEAKKLVVKVWKKLFFIGFIPVIIIMMYGNMIFGFVFGENWRVAGEIAQVMVVMYFVLFISSPTSSAYNVLEMQKLGLAFGTVCLIYRTFIFIVLIRTYDLFFILKIYVFIEILIVISYNIIVLQVLKRREENERNY